MSKLLIIDDERLTADLLEMYLRAKGFEVISAQNAHEGMLRAETDHPDLIILDMMMPDLSGDTVTTMLRSAPATAQLPILILSALYSLDAQQKARTAGANYYLPKNSPLPELLAQVKRLLAEYAAAKADTPVQGTSVPTDITPSKTAPSNTPPSDKPKGKTPHGP